MTGGTTVDARPEILPGDIAVVGIGLRFPGASTLPEFRANLLAGKDCVGPMPEDRLAATGLDPAVAYLPMGHIEDIDTFDHAFFGLSKREASLIDPQQRLGLVLAYRAIEDAGFAVTDFRDSATAVVFSASTSTYHATVTEPGALSALGNLPFGLPARIAHLLGLAGPCYAVDSGCNGSLIAVHHACRELSTGDVGYALAGGVSLRPGGMPATEAGVLSELVSATGRCRAFDAAADGAVAGEGGAVVLLTTVERAMADGAPVHAVLRGSATLHNGRAAPTISTPSARAQATVIARAWRAAGTDPALAGYLETHGSGTPLGDAVELEGIAIAFGQRSGRLPIGSVKASIGHLDHAAGVVGLIKAVLSVRHGELYPSPHFERLPAGAEAAEVEVVTAARPWECDDGPRLAGVSSFSLGGINAHCVVREPPPLPDRPEHQTGQRALVGVSARDRAALATLCRDLAVALRGSDLDFRDVVFTLNRGRTHHEHRIAVLARDTEDLAVQLAAQATWLAAEEPGPLAVGLPEPGRSYERGADIDWAAVSPAMARRVRLPGHPLRGSSCWARPVVTHVPEPVPVPAPDAGEPVDLDRVEWLCSTLTELLYAETAVGPDADYFELGGNSLLAVELVNRIEARFGTRPRLIDIYERPRVADFAELIGAGATGLPAITVRDELVMSFGQERMWFHHQLDGDTTLYNLPMVSHVRGPIDVDAVRGMWEDLARRHEVLRSNFVEVDGAPVLRIREDLGDFARFVDVSGEPDPTSAARDLVREAASIRFDLARDPLLRLLVVRLGPDEHVIQVTMHHAVNDGAAPKIFQRELPELYAARRAGRPARLEPLPVRFRDFAKWQRDLLASEALDHELAYWLRVLDGAPRLDLPTDLPRPARKNFTGALHTFTIDGPLLRELRVLAARESVTLFVVLLAALYLLLARHSGQRDLVVGTPTSGRNRTELRGLLGYFNSTVALRADLSGEHTVAGLLRQVRSVVLDALEHQEIPFDRVVSALGEERDLSRTPVFDVCHIHQELPPNQPIDTAEVGYFDTEHTAVNAFGGIPAGTSKFDLTLLTGGPEGEPDMAAALEYSTELFLPATAARLTADYLVVLHGIAADLSLTRLLAGQAPVVMVPTDRHRPAVPQYRLASVSTVLPTEFADRGEAALLAAWLTLLAWITGEDELAVTVPGGHIHVDLSDGPGFAELVDEVERTLTEPPSSDTDLPLGFGAEPAPSGELWVAWDGGDCRLHYATELFDEHTAVALVADLRRLLGGLADRPELPVHEVAAGHVGRVEVVR